MAGECVLLLAAMILGPDGTTVLEQQDETIPLESCDERILRAQVQTIIPLQPEEPRT